MNGGQTASGGIPGNPPESEGIRGEEGHPTAGDPRTRIRCEDDLRTRLAEKEILLREVHHRVKNDIAALGSYLSLRTGTLPEGSPARRVLQETRTRLEGLSRLYGRLSRSEDYATLPAGDYLAELVEELRFLESDPGRVEIRAELEDIPLDARVLKTLGLAVNELVVNAVKHAFPGGRRGVVRVVLRREEDGGILAEVSDDGVGMPPAGDLRDGLGRVLVPALVDQIRGRLEETSRPGGGSVFRIRIPQDQGLRA